MARTKKEKKKKGKGKRNAVYQANGIEVSFSLFEISHGIDIDGDLNAASV
jgi:hypothetical protein